MPSNYIKVLETLIREQRPELDIRSITPFHDQVLKTHALLLAPLKVDVDNLASYKSLANTGMPEAEFDLLVANLLLSRILGTSASGTARIYLSSPVSITVRATDAFVSSGGLSFFPQTDYFFPEGVIRLNVEGDLFFVDIVVQAEAPGTQYRIPAHSLVTVQGSAFDFVRVDNPFDFATGGEDRETNAELSLRAKDAVTVRDLLVGKGIRTILQENFAFIEDLFIAGYLDPEQQRDLVGQVHIGGQADIYLRTASLTTDDFDVLSPSSQGHFELFTGEGAARRPVVFFNSISVLNEIGQVTGSPLRRIERTEVGIKALVTTGTYQEINMDVDPSVSQIHVMAIETADTGKKYAVYMRQDLFGNQLIAPTRISTGLVAASGPFVISGSNRAYLFWGEGGELKYAVLDATAGSLTYVRSPDTLVFGEAIIQLRKDAWVDVDGNCHLVFTRETPKEDGTSTELVWYARIKPDGLPPATNPPRQAAYEVLGRNTAPTVVVTESPTRKITILFVGDLETVANLYAVQLDDTGALINEQAVNLTLNNRKNRQPTAWVDSAEGINVFWVEGGLRIRFMKIQHELGTLIPNTRVSTRTSEVKTMRSAMNLFDYNYVSWVEDLGDFEDVMSLKVDNEGTAVGQVQDISVTPYFSSNQSLELDTAGNIHVVWEDGVRGTNKPFYTRRTPQEYHLTVFDKNQRYGADEQLAVSPHVPSLFGIRAEVQYASLLPQVQEFVLDDQQRVATAGLLVRHFLPGKVFMDVVFGPANGTLTTSAAKALLEDHISGFKGTTISTSELIDLLHNNGATSVSPFYVTVEIDDLDGSITVLKSNDQVVLPRNVRMYVGDITATFRGA